MPLAVACLSAQAVDGAAPFVAPAPAVVLAGEIILSPSPGGPAAGESEAARMREAAREQRKGKNSAPVVVIVDDAEDGVLSPRRGPSSPADNAAKARAYRVEGETDNASQPSVILGPLPSDASPPTDSVSAQKAHGNRMRATEYRKGESYSSSSSSSSVTARVGDGLPVVDCSNVDNVAGRIGDDTRSGSVVILVQGRNQVKVRCR